MENQTMNKKMEFAVAMVNAYKNSKNPWVSPKFTKVEINEDSECVVTRDLYKLYQTAAIQIAKKYDILDKQGICDDDTIADWISMYDGDLGLLQKHYPNITISEVADLLTWYNFCQQRAGSPCPLQIIDILTHR